MSSSHAMCGPSRDPFSAVGAAQGREADLTVHEFARSAASRDLDLRAVRCLLVLSEERHYGHAAERLHMSQPGLSRTIAVLEARVGACLVLRSARPVRLTPEGEVLASHGRRLLAEQEEAFKDLATAAAANGSAPVQPNSTEGCETSVDSADDRIAS
ncbi:MAG: LysR family transcriptional regulator [Solirubrobacteraceae bacterium]